MLTSLRNILPIWSLSSFCQNANPAGVLLPSLPPTQDDMPSPIERLIPALEDNYESLLCARFDQLAIGPRTTPFRNSTFGNLPLELRQMIYVFTLMPDNTVGECNEPCTIKRKPGSNRFSLLGVCRQVYFETRLIFFSRWTFYLEDARHLYSFLIIIGRAREHLKEIYLGPIIVPRPSWRREVTESRLAGLGVLEKYEEEVKELLTPELDPMIFNAKPLLRQCKNLKRIFFDVYKGSQHKYYEIFGGPCFLWIYYKKMIIQNLGHWCILDNPDRGDYESVGLPMEYIGFTMDKWHGRGRKSLKRLLVELKSSPESVFKGSYEPGKSAVFQ